MRHAKRRDYKKEIIEIILEEIIPYNIINIKSLPQTNLQIHNFTVYSVHLHKARLFVKAQLRG